MTDNTTTPRKPYIKFPPFTVGDALDENGLPEVKRFYGTKREYDTQTEKQILITEAQKMWTKAVAYAKANAKMLIQELQRTKPEGIAAENLLTAENSFNESQKPDEEERYKNTSMVYSAYWALTGLANMQEIVEAREQEEKALLEAKKLVDEILPELIQLRDDNISYGIVAQLTDNAEAAYKAGNYGRAYLDAKSAKGKIRPGAIAEAIEAGAGNAEIVNTPKGPKMKVRKGAVKEKYTHGRNK